MLKVIRLLARKFSLATTAAALLLGCTVAVGEEGNVDFAREVQPIFAKRCYKCHGPGKNEGGLRLNSREAVLAELDSGEVAVSSGCLSGPSLDLGPDR